MFKENYLLSVLMSFTIKMHNSKTIYNTEMKLRTCVNDDSRVNCYKKLKNIYIEKLKYVCTFEIFYVNLYNKEVNKEIKNEII